MSERLSILWHYARARRRATAWSDRAALERWQESRVRRHLGRIAKRSPHFAGLVSEYGIDRWREWPVANKAIMMN